MPPPSTPEVRRGALRQGLVLARVGIVAWVLVIVAGTVLVFVRQPWYLWAVLVAFGILRLVLDVRRLRAIGRDLAELDEDEDEDVDAEDAPEAADEDDPEARD